MERMKTLANRVTGMTVVSYFDLFHGSTAIVGRNLGLLYEVFQVVIPVAKVGEDFIALLGAEATLDAAPFE